MIKKVKNLYNHLCARIFLNSDEELLLEKLKKINTEERVHNNDKKEEINIILQMPEDYYFLIKFYLFYRTLKKNYSKVNVGLIQLSDSLYRKSKITRIQNSFLYDLKWNNIYKRLFNGEVVFNYNLKRAVIRTEDKLEAEKIFTSYRSKQDVLQTKYKNYPIGHLVYNYYLRTANEPTIDLNSEILFEILLNTIRSLNELEIIFQNNKYDIFLTSYITYTAHGVPALVALGKGARVFSFSGLDQFYLEVFPTFFTHVKNYLSYKDLKHTLSEDSLNLAKDKMEERLKGIVDISTSYMRQSSYSYTNNNFKFERTKPSVVVYLHCFFDSPHVYRGMLFPDFYEWLKHTLTTLSKNEELEIYIKKHPGALGSNDQVVDEILTQFSNVKIIPHDFNNVQIAKEMKPKAIITVHGTVAHEMAYMGIPVICAGDNPHAGFDFQKTPSTISEYELIIADIGKTNPYSNDKFEHIQKEVLRFFYLHNCYEFIEKLNHDEQAEHNYLLKLFRDGNLKEFLQKLGPDSFDKTINKIQRQYFQVEK